MARNRAQTSFFGSDFKRQLPFGGSLCGKSHPKGKRSISTRLPMHVVIRSEKARGERSMRASAERMRRVDAIVRGEAKRFGVRVIEFSNVGNHCHMLLKAFNRRLFISFLRSMTSRLARLLTGARRGRPAEGKFWDFRPFTRVVESHRGYRIARDYVLKNRLEAEGIVPPRKKPGG